MSSVDTSVPHEATVTFTGRPTVTREYTSAGFASTEGHTPSAGASVTALAEALWITVGGTSGTYATKSRTAGASGGWLRVRAWVRLEEAEDRPARVWISDPSGQGNPPWVDTVSAGDWGRLVSGDLVLVEGWVPRTTTSVRINVAKPTGATNAVLLVEQIVWDTFDESNYTYGVFRIDANGTALVRSYRDLDGDPVAGSLVLVDREASLVGEVTWELRDWPDNPSSTLLDDVAATLDSSGFAVIHRVHDPLSEVHEVTLLEFTYGRSSRAVPLEVVDDEFPVVPIVGALSARVGTFGLRFGTFDEATDVLDDLASGEVSMLRQTVDTRRRLDCYFVVTSLDLTRADVDGQAEPFWDVTGSFVETSRGVA